MRDGRQRGICRLSILLLGLLIWAGGASGKPPEPVLLVVMDPLAKEMACACVKGYGQRDYRKLAARLESALKQRVTLEFSDDLADTLASAGPVPEVIVIGEQSKVSKGAQVAGLKCHPVCELTNPEGDTTLSGLFVARSLDPAKQLQDIGGRTLYFALADTEANHAAVRAALRAAGVEPPVREERRAQHSDAALDVLDSPASPLPVAVIPNYALRLLEGCGSLKPGELKVIGKTEPVPFITVFLAGQIQPEKERKLLQTLLAVKNDAKLLRAMESRDGFKPSPDYKPENSKRNAEADWPDWRGPGRNGRVSQLPKRLPEQAKIIWKKGAMPGGLAGLSVSGKRLLLAERDFGDEFDVYRCLDADTGELRWRVEYPARGHLDYGQAPRATPVIRQERAYLLGAFGELRCVNLANGKLIWKRQLPAEFQAELSAWGMCATPLVVDDLIIVNPGGANASLAALDCATGRTRWTTPGLPAAYAAFICGEFGGQRQIVGYDQHSLGGWEVSTGKRLWQLVPPTPGDFNVPTPMAVDGGLVVSTENNGTRFYRFYGSGKIIPQPAGESAELAPDTSSPVVTNGRIFGLHQGLRCLDLQQGVKPVWHHEDAALGDYATLIADAERVLVITLGGELILLDAKTDDCAIISRLRVFKDDVETYSHPALVGTRLYLRGGSSVVCVDLGIN